MIDEKFIVDLKYIPDYFERFLHYCNDIADQNNWDVRTVINYNLKPHGRLIRTKTQGMYLRWDEPKHHTMFMLRWA